jgi:hypothetical protein
MKPWIEVYILDEMFIKFDWNKNNCLLLNYKIIWTHAK